MTGPAGFAARIQRWQQRHGRHHLPWQGTGDPYRVWLSEIMLQQTQVAAVIGYYHRFLGRFPDVQALAAAPLEDVLALWAGLGYYSRARMLHRAAIEVVARHGGVFPRSAAVLATLPGIGRSTAAAIAAFCFGERVAILDGNVKRVLTRVLGFSGDLARAAEEKALWSRAEAMLPEDDVAGYTQGLMDLGATVCLPRRPRCDICPVADACVARAEGEPQRYPVKSRRLVRGQRDNALLLLTQSAAVFLVPRAPEGVWGGLWSLPEFDDAAALAEATGHWPGERQPLTPVRHVLTHFDWMLRPFWIAFGGGAIPPPEVHALWPQGRWVTADALPRFGLPAPIRALLARIAETASGDDLLLAQEVGHQP